MKKVVSIAIFGERTRYSVFLPAFVRAHLALFPVADGWELRVHHDQHIDGNYGGPLRRLQERGLVRLVRMESAPLTKSMLWRMAPVFDPTVDYVFCRDVDALPTPRDRACCERFIASGCDVQICADSRSHDGCMGGMGGYRADTFRELTGMQSLGDLVAYGNKTETEWATHGTDQIVLNRLILGWGADGVPLSRLAIFEHRYAGWASGKPYDGEGWKLRSPNPRACVSEPVPDAGYAPGLTAEETAAADALSAHMGAAGFDHERAATFYDLLGTSGEVLRAEREVKRFSAEPWMVTCD